ncbi:pentapeptide repeat-containing protein [Maridesulfovibrio sp.]|uniref:pentapeptide repeat-containing protein n=1 Tax=Maridesulfovibrio sp. TaxID=2795000 RepID=UPI0039F0B969
MDRDEIIYICPECGYEDRALFYSSDSSDFRAGDTQSYNADRERGMLEKVCPECSRSTLTRKQWHLEHLKKLTGIEGLTMEDFLSALEQGPDYFNSWSSDKDLFEQIYAGVDLRRYDLRGIRLRNCSFKEAIVKGCDFSNAKFYKADFSGADWTGCCFHKVAFYDSKLNSIKCENAEFSNCNASLGASFEHSIMNGCNFSEARLRHVSFAFCSLQNSCFKNADIEGASFARADLSHADMRTAKIDTDSYLKPKKPDFMLAVTENAIFNEGEHPAGHSYIHHLCEQLGASYKQEYFDGPKGDSFYTYKLKYVLDGQDDYVRELIKARLSPYFKPLIEKVQARESLDSYLRFLVQKNKERVSSGTEALLTYLEIWLRALGTDKDRASQAVTELKQNSSPVPPLPNNPQPFESWLEPLSGVEFTWLPSGTFIMGSPEDENGRQDDEGPQHEVQLDGFWIGRFPVTNLQWRAVYLLEGELPQIDHPVGTTPWRTPLKPGKSNFPVEKLRFGIPVGNYFNPATNISWTWQNSI